MLFTKIRSAARSLFFPSWTIPFALLTVVLLGYGLRALSLGFYWDDLPYLWYFHRFGPAGILAAFTEDRPFLSFIYTTTLGWFGSSSQAWQIFALLTRWLCSLGFWWLLALTWPRHIHKAAWAALLFAVYPGFTQQWIAVIYGQAFLLFSSTFFSIGITLWLVQRRGRLPIWLLAAATLLALGLSAFSMFSTEYFFGLELLRPILVWVILSGGVPVSLWRRVRQALAWWLPFLLLMVVFVIWRGFIHIFPAASLSTLQSMEQSPAGALKNLAATILGDLIEASVAAWGQPLQLAGILETSLGSGLRLLVVIFLTGIICAVYLARLCPDRDESPAGPETDRWAVQAILVGGLALLAAGWPFWITGLPMRMGFPQDRYTLPLAPGICLVGAGLVDLLGGAAGRYPGLQRKAVMIAAAVGLAAGFHFSTASRYLQDQQAMQNFFWQLAWRAPAVQPSTLLLTADLPFHYYEDDSLSAALNWMYDPAGNTTEMNYILFDLGINRGSIPDLSPERPVDKDFRATFFEGNTSQALVVYYAPPGCVHILDPLQDAENYYLPDELQSVLKLSGPRSWIVDSPAPAAPPVVIAGGEPRHTWCYYYQKAELARQAQDWFGILRIRDESIVKGLRPEDPSEYLPFVEAYVRTWKLDDAVEVTETTVRQAPDLAPALCSIWKRGVEAGIELNEKYRSQIMSLIQCSAP